MKETIYAMLMICMLACNQKSKNTNGKAEVADKQFVTATLDGKAWQSIPGEILASYSDFDDKLQVFTKDAGGKTNVLLSLQPFSKTGVGNYNSVKENAGGFGISLIDDNATDNEVWDYDNYRQGATANCITITAIKETTEGKMITGTYKSDLNESNNYEGATNKVVSIDGAFAVMLKK